MATERDEIAWSWAGREVRVGVERRGAELTVLLLPAPSSISTRAELRPLAASFSTVAVDWPGSGDGRPAPRSSPTPSGRFLRKVREMPR